MPTLEDCSSKTFEDASQENAAQKEYEFMGANSDQFFERLSKTGSHDFLEMEPTSLYCSVHGWRLKGKKLMLKLK